MTAFPSLDFSSATMFNDAWAGSTQLRDFPAHMFDRTGTLIPTAFSGAFNWGVPLTVASVENILVSLDTNGQRGITLDFNGAARESTWTATAKAAKAALVGKGWTITNNP
jgi:hypothetical protein